METTAQRQMPLIVVAGREGTAALVECLRAQGALVYLTHTPEGCLRVATSVRPDLLLLPRDFPHRVVRLLQQHPTSQGARIVWFQTLTADDSVLLAEEGAAAVDELDRSADPVGVLPHVVQPFQLARMMGQLAGECLEPSGPAHA
jgi:hypothetical protein